MRYGLGVVLGTLLLLLISIQSWAQVPAVPASGPAAAPFVFVTTQNITKLLAVNEDGRGLFLAMIAITGASAPMPLTINVGPNDGVVLDGSYFSDIGGSGAIAPGQTSLTVQGLSFVFVTFHMRWANPGADINPTISVVPIPGASGLWNSFWTLSVGGDLDLGSDTSPAADLSEETNPASVPLIGASGVPADVTGLTPLTITLNGPLQAASTNVQLTRIPTDPGQVRVFTSSGSEIQLLDAWDPVNQNNLRLTDYGAAPGATSVTLYVGGTSPGFGRLQGIFAIGTMGPELTAFDIVAFNATAAASVTVTSLTVADNSHPSSQAMDPTDTELYLCADAAGSASIRIAAVVDPDNPAARAQALWSVEGSEALPTEGNFGGANPIVALSSAGGNRDFIVRAGGDDNYNGILDPGEMERTIAVHLVSLVNLTATDATDPANSVTSPGGSDLFLTLGASGVANVTAGVTIAPNTPAARAHVLWRVQGEGAASVSGSFPADSVSIALTPPNPDRGADFSLQAGCDVNGNGTLDAEEISQQIALHVVPFLSEIQINNTVDQGDDLVCLGHLLRGRIRQRLESPVARTVLLRASGEFSFSGNSTLTISLPARTAAEEGWATFTIQGDELSAELNDATVEALAQDASGAVTGQEDLTVFRVVVSGPRIICLGDTAKFTSSTLPEGITGDYRWQLVTPGGTGPNAEAAISGSDTDADLNVRGLKESRGVDRNKVRVKLRPSPALDWCIPSDEPEHPGGWSTFTVVTLAIRAFAIDADNPTDGLRLLSSGVVYGGSIDPFSDKLSLSGTVRPAVTGLELSWTITGPGSNAYSPPGPVENAAATTWAVGAVSPKPGVLTFTFLAQDADGHSCSTTKEVEVGVRTDDVVVIGTINPARVPVNRLGVHDSVVHYFPTDGPAMLDFAEQLVRLDYLGGFVAGSTSCPDPEEGDLTPADKHYILNWFFHFAGNFDPLPDHFDSPSDADLFAAQTTRFKLYSHYQVRYRAPDGTHILPDVGVIHMKTAIGRTSVPLLISLDGEAGPLEGQKIESSIDTNLINDGHPEGGGVLLLNALAVPNMWSNIGSRIQFGPALETNGDQKHQIYPTYSIYVNGVRTRVDHQPLDPLANFVANPYPPGPAPFLVP